MKSKEEIQNKLKEERGITLIALVVTIIVIFIISGLLINTIAGNKGVLEQSQKAQEKTKEKINRDDTEVNDLLEELEDQMTEDDWWRTNYTVNKKTNEDDTAQIELYSIYYKEYSEGDAETEIPEIIQKKTYTITFPNGETTTIPGKDLGSFKYPYTATQNGLITIKIVSNKETTLTVAVEGIIHKQVEDAWYTYTYDKNTNGYKVTVKDTLLTTYGPIKNRIDDLPITSLAGTFSGCTNMTSVDLKELDTTYVTSMKNMFVGCNKVTELDVSNFNTENVTNMESMFSSCSNLTQLDVSNFVTINVKNMMGMFNSCSNLMELDVSNFKTSKVEDMRLMFYKCNNMTSVNLEGLDTSKVTKMKNMFGQCSNLTKLDVSEFKTEAVEDMDGMFSYCEKLTRLELSNFKTSKVTTMRNMFLNCTSLTVLDISNFDTNKVEDMYQMFNNCGELKTIYKGINWVIKDTTNTDNMFKGCGTSTLTLREQI